MLTSLAAFSLIAAAQAAGAETRSPEDARLTVCLNRAASQPVDGVAMASEWLREASASSLPALRSKPLQCLGHGYAMQQRWQQAQDAFAEAASLAGAGDAPRVIELWTLAGNAALAGNDAARAQQFFGDALLLADATDAFPDAAKGAIRVDMARSYGAMGQMDAAGEQLVAAQALSPQDPLVWLLSATLARRNGDLALAQRNIEVAAGLAADDAEIGLEAGVIAVLADREDAARRSWEAVIALAPDSAEAQTARGYLAQLAGQ